MIDLSNEWDAFLGCLVTIIVSIFLFVVAVLVVKLVWGLV